MKNQNNQTTNKASDTQVGGDHYQSMGDFQPWDVLAKWLTPEEYRGYQKGVAIAYLARERSKGKDQDIKKALHHLQRLVEEFEEKEHKEKEQIVEEFSYSDKLMASLESENRLNKAGWRSWFGGECPVRVGTCVEIVYRNGTRCAGFPPHFYDWGHAADFPLHDIIAYRVVKGFAK